MTTLFLIRHGLTGLTGTRLYGRTPGIDLDDRGRAQAEALAARFEPIRLAAIYSSPLERCVQTVEPLAARKRLEVRPCDALIEMDAGRWTNRTLTSLRRARDWTTVQRTPSLFRFPEGEAFTEAHERIVGEVQRIAARHPKGNVAVASHGDLVRILVAHYSGAHLDHFQRTSIDAASVSVIQLGGGIPRILLVNDTGGLERFAPTPRAAGAKRSPGTRPATKTSSRRNLRG
ncbi:MAG: histidine phosphatase family protein [Actinomycetota bacterium]